MMKRVLLTGATGFIGQKTIIPLINKGYEIHAISTQAMSSDDVIQWHKVDLLNHEVTAFTLLKIQPTHLLHLAWYVEPGKYWKSEQNFKWLEASISLLRSFKEAGGKRAVMAGTCAEYDWRYGYCTEGLTPLSPMSSYGVCKNALREVIDCYSNERLLSTAWGRIFFLYGPNENSSRLVASVIGALMNKDKALCTHGNQIRDFLHVEDVAQGFVDLLNSTVEGPVNICSGYPLSIRELTLKVAEKIGAQKEKIVFGALPSPDNDVPLIVGNNTRLSNEVGWHQKYDVESGILNTVNSYTNRASD